MTTDILLSGDRGRQGKLFSTIAVFSFWTIIAAIFTTQSNLYYTLQGIPTSWLHLSIHHLASAWTWVLLTPLIYWLYKRGISGQRNLLMTISSIALTISVIAIIHRTSCLILDIAFRKYMFHIDGSILENLVAMDSLFISGLFDSAMVVLLVLAFFFGADIVRDRKNQAKSTDRVYEETNRITVKQNGQFLFIDPSQLAAITAEGNYVKLHLIGQKPVLVRETMTRFLGKLQQDEFLRINRSFIANVNHVQSLQHKFNGEYTLTLDNGTKAVTSKRFGDSWKRLLD